MKPYWIKERHNPPLGVYYVGCGQLSVTAARRHETKSLYGMIRIETEAEYEFELNRLREDGERVYQD